MPGGQLFELRTLLSLKQEKITPHLEPNLQKMSELVSYLRGRGGKEENELNAQIHFFPQHFMFAGALIKYQQVQKCKDKIWWKMQNVDCL